MYLLNYWRCISLLTSNWIRMFWGCCYWQRFSRQSQIHECKNNLNQDKHNKTTKKSKSVKPRSKLTRTGRRIKETFSHLLCLFSYHRYTLFFSKNTLVLISLHPTSAARQVVVVYILRNASCFLPTEALSGQPLKVIPLHLLVSREMYCIVIK